MTDQTKRRNDELLRCNFEKVNDEPSNEKKVPVPVDAVRTAAGYKTKKEDKGRTPYVTPSVAIGLLPHLEKEDRRHLRELLHAEEVYRREISNSGSWSRL